MGCWRFSSSSSSWFSSSWGDCLYLASRYSFDPLQHAYIHTYLHRHTCTRICTHAHMCIHPLGCINDNIKWHYLARINDNNKCSMASQSEWVLQVGLQIKFCRLLDKEWLMCPKCVDDFTRLTNTSFNKNSCPSIQLSRPLYK